jgi:hypothetical protein
MIPIIIMSTITGTANFAQNTFPLVIRPYIPQIIGAINLIAAILTTIYQYLKISEYMESHRLTGVNYGKFSRNITVELSLPIKDRSIGGKELVKISRLDIDRLIEQSPSIPKHILIAYELKFADSGLAPPEIITIKRVNIYDDKEQKLMNKVVEKFKNVINGNTGNTGINAKTTNNRTNVYPPRYKSSSPISKIKDNLTSELNNLKNSRIVSNFGSSIGSSIKNLITVGSNGSTLLGTISENNSDKSLENNSEKDSEKGFENNEHNENNNENIIPLTNENITKLTNELEEIIINNSESSENSEDFHEAN